MATKNSFFVTSETKPITPPVGTVKSDVSVKEVGKLPPAALNGISKAAGFCVYTDFDLNKARAIIRAKLLGKIFGVSLNVPEINCAIEDNLKKSLGNLSKAGLSVESELDALTNKYLLAKDAEALCKQLEEDCPICPDWPDVLSVLSLAKLYSQFSTMLDKIIAFGDPKLLEMFLHCPEYLAKSSIKQLNSALTQMKDDGQVDMIKTLVSTANPLKLRSLNKSIVDAIKNTDRQDTTTVASLDALIEVTGLMKEDLVIAEAHGLNNDHEVLDASSTSDVSASGTAMMEDTINPSTQMMAGATVNLLHSRQVTTSSSVPANKGYWKDDTGYIHIIDMNKLSSSERDSIFNNNRSVRKQKARSTNLEVLDMRSNAGQPIDLNGCVAIT